MQVKRDPTYLLLPGESRYIKQHVITCKTTECGGWCFSDQKEIGNFECPICKNYTCISCDMQHYPFTCEQVQLVSLPSVSQHVNVLLLKDFLSVDQIQKDILPAIFFGKISVVEFLGA